ncbi:hypothetical protein BLNAU_6442 [Blattamonas nauphoetae]|uniref:Uncharacterized protein n=1 Tax=Blattamonas nauphoetae TaxID=2049346 RepID=A0ABQ9Y4P6_9EUKA|nr:hypothetical protein BLNAU_6442 [Blattamonas nauphoetae]
MYINKQTSPIVYLGFNQLGSHITRCTQGDLTIFSIKSPNQVIQSYHSQQTDLSIATQFFTSQALFGASYRHSEPEVSSNFAMFKAQRGYKLAAQNKYIIDGRVISIKSNKAVIAVITYRGIYILNIENTELKPQFYINLPFSLRYSTAVDLTTVFDKFPTNIQCTANLIAYPLSDQKGLVAVQDVSSIPAGCSAPIQSMVTKTEHGTMHITPEVFSNLHPSALHNDQPSTRWEFTAHTDPVQCVAFSRDGTLLATASRKGTRIRVWSVQFRTQTVECLRTSKGTQCTIYSLAFSADNRLLACSGSSQTIHVFDLSASEQTGMAAGFMKFARTLGGIMTPKAQSPGQKENVKELHSALQIRPDLPPGQSVPQTTLTFFDPDRKDATPVVDSPHPFYQLNVADDSDGLAIYSITPGDTGLILSETNCFKLSKILP